MKIIPNWQFAMGNGREGEINGVINQEGNKFAHCPLAILFLPTQLQSHL
jgi:hypothetical protein